MRCAPAYSAARGAHAGFRFAVRQIAGPVLVPHRGDLAVARRAEAHTLNGRGSMRRVVEHERTRQRHLDGSLHGARRERREQCIRAHEQLSAEAAADVRREHAHVLRRNLQRDRDVALRPCNHLVRGPQRQLLAFPGGDGRVRLHHGVRLVGRGVRGIQLDGRRREGTGEIAHGRVGAPPNMRGGFAAVSFARARSNAPCVAS